MKHPALAWLPAVGWLPVLALLIAGCNMVPPAQLDATHFYVLTGPAPAPGPVIGHLRLGLKTVELASFLNTRDIVVRSGTNELMLQDYARWAEPLGAGIGRILRLQLTADPAIGRVYPQPFPFEAERDYDVAVNVIRCEGETESGLTGRSSARFAAVIEITTPGPEARVVARRTFVAPNAPWDGRDYARLAALLSEDVAALAHEIIAALPDK